MEEKSISSEVTTDAELGKKNTKPLPIQDINDAESYNKLHFDGNSTFYALNEYEFKIIKNGADNYWKEFSIASWGVFLPFLLNALNEASRLNWDSSSWNLFFNGSFTLVTLILAIVFSIAWNRSTNEVNKVLKEVEDKPTFKV